MSENIHFPSGADGLLLNLNEEQRHAVTSKQVPLAIHAGAGSGKTRVLTHRIAWRIAMDIDDARKVLALTFTRKAAAELNHRLRGLGIRDQVAAGTFHAVAYAQLKNFWREKSLPEPELLTNKSVFVTKLLPRDYRSIKVLDVVGEIEWAKARRIGPQAYAGMAEENRRNIGIPSSLIGQIYQNYEDLKREQNKVDFDDLLVFCAKAIRSDRSFAAAQQWRFQHLYVDEFQDVNSVQVELLNAWLNGNENLCVVGDPNQAIYGWNGADADHLVRFGTYFPGGEIVDLKQNYRNTPQILRTATSILEDTTFKANRSSGSNPTITHFSSDKDELTSVAQRVRENRGPNGRWSDQAVLTRTNTQVEALARAFRDVEIPVRTLAGSSLFDRGDVKRVLSSFENNNQPLTELLGDLHAGFDEDEEYEIPARQQERFNAFSEIRLLAKEHLALDPTATADGFLSWIKSHIRTVTDISIDAVEIATFHSAKGLEWPTVHLVGLEEGFVPISYARDADSLAEEKRLLYVALSRAKENLFISWAGERSFGDKEPIGRDPSRWLEQIQEAINSLDKPLNKEGQIDQIRKARSGKTSNSASEHPVKTALLSWRSEHAQYASLQPYEVLSDAALEALIQSWPATIEGMENIPAVTSHNIQRYGEELLSIFRQFDPPNIDSQIQRAVEGDSLLEGSEGQIISDLKVWRIEKAAGKPAFTIFNDETLRDLAKKRPENLDELLSVYGIGPAKAEKFGQDLLKFFNK